MSSIQLFKLRKSVRKIFIILNRNAIIFFTNDAQWECKRLIACLTIYYFDGIISPLCVYISNDSVTRRQSRQYTTTASIQHKAEMQIPW